MDATLWLDSYGMQRLKRPCWRELVHNSVSKWANRTGKAAAGRCTIKIVGTVDPQPRHRLAAIVASGELVQHGFRRSGQAENGAKAELSAAERGSIEVAVFVVHQRRVRNRAIVAAREPVQNCLDAGGHLKFENRPTAASIRVGAVARQAAMRGRAVKVAVQIKQRRKWAAAVGASAKSIKQNVIPRSRELIDRAVAANTIGIARPVAAAQSRAVEISRPVLHQPCGRETSITISGGIAGEIMKNRFRKAARSNLIHHSRVKRSSLQRSAIEVPGIDDQSPIRTLPRIGSTRTGETEQQLLGNLALRLPRRSANAQQETD